MSLKFKLDSLEGLDDATKALYVQRGNRFILDIEPAEEGDIVDLKNRREALFCEIADLNRQLKEKDEAIKSADEQSRVASEQVTVLSGEMVSLRTSTDQRIAEAVTSTTNDCQSTIDKRVASIRKETIKQAALKFLSDIALPGNDALLMPHVVSRLACDQFGDEWRVSVLDTDGKPLPISIDALKEEFRNSPTMRGIVRGADQSDQAAHARKVAAVLGTPIR